MHSRWRPRSRRCPRRGQLLATVLVLQAFSAGSAGFTQAPPRPVAPEEASSELARIKQEEAREKLRGLEETMDRLARMLATTEPQNAAKLRSAFQASRERLVREGMDRVVRFIEEKKLDRALEGQTNVDSSLKELLAILLEKDIDPRELLKHIRNVRDVLTGLDQVIKEETAEKIASDQAAEAETPLQQLSDAAVKLDDLIRKQKDVEGAIAAQQPAAEPKEGETSEDAQKRAEAGAKLRELSPRQRELQGDTGKLRAQAADAQGGEASPGKEGSGLDAKSLAGAEKSMADAAGALDGGEGGKAGEAAKRAREQLEAARRDAEAKLDAMRQKRDFAKMQGEQQATQKRTDELLERMKRTPPLISSPEGGVPGRADVQQASASMGEASESLGGGQAGKAGKEQKQALDQLGGGQRQVEETLEALQRALRERILSYLRERLTQMLDGQKRIARETQSLDARLRALALARAAAGEGGAPAAAGAEAGAAAVTPAAEAEAPANVDRRDLQRAEDLSRGEAALAAICDDVLDLLQEDGTTVVFPRIVEELKRDVENVQGLLARVRAGELTQRIQKEIIATIEEILEAIKEAQRSPPPPNPDQGRQSKSGAGPLLPTSAELKMIRSMQQRVNKRTRDFHLDRRAEELDLEEQRQAKLIAERQKEIEGLFRKMSRALGE